MPIFMDRHDIQSQVTPEDVANLHVQDLKIQDQFNCRALTYWFDEVRQTAFCLIEAPDEQSIIDLHTHAHGEVPHQVIAVEASIVESFLGRIEDPEKAQNAELNIINDPAFRTIMIVDIKQQPVVPNNQPASNRYRQVLLSLLDTHDGKLVRQANGRFLISFQSVTKAVHAAIQINLSLKNIRTTDKPLLKITLSAGVPVTENNLIFADAIKMAERMCKVVKGEIILAADVKNLYDSENADALNANAYICCLTKTDEQFMNILMDQVELSWNNTSLKVDDLGRSLGFSKSQLYRKMIQLTGESPNNFIHEYRLSEALTLLSKQLNNVSEIAFETGFTSPSYFSKCFRKKYGHFPSHYLPAKQGYTSARADYAV